MTSTKYLEKVRGLGMIKFDIIARNNAITALYGSELGLQKCSILTTVEIIAHIYPELTHTLS